MTMRLRLSGIDGRAMTGMQVGWQTRSSTSSPQRWCQNVRSVLFHDRDLSYQKHLAFSPYLVVERLERKSSAPRSIVVNKKSLN